MWSTIKNFILKYLEFNKQYKLKLVFMLSCIFITFIGTLIYIIHIKSINGIEPILLNIDTNTFLGKVVTSKAFKASSKFLFSYWNLGPSYETLLGLIVLSFFLLIFLILMSTYLKIIFIPLTILTTFIFYNLYDILKNQYYVENTVEIFNKFGIILKKNIDLPKIIPKNEINENIDILKNIFINKAQLNNKVCDLTLLDTNKLINELVEKKYTNWEDFNLYIVDYLEKNIIIKNIDWSTWTYNAIGYIYDNALFGLNKVYTFITINPGTTIMFIITISGIIYIYILTNSLQKEIVCIADVQDKQKNIVEALNRKTETTDTTLIKATDSLNVSTKNSTALTEQVNNLNENLKITNAQVGKLSESLEVQGKGTLNLFDKLVGIANFNGDIPISLSDLIVNQSLMNERLNQLISAIEKINQIIKNQSK